MQHYVIKFVSDLRQIGCFLRVLRLTEHHDITEILLNVALNTISNQQSACGPKNKSRYDIHFG